MKKFLFSDEYKKAKVIGFDLDGTLYDEFEFIKQVYSNIVNRAIPKTLNKLEILNFMLLRWLEKGSSYPFIFRETIERFKLNSEFESKALEMFRNTEPELKLSSRIEFILAKIKNQDKKQTFLLTDGRNKLQNRKIEALKIKNCFELIIIAEKFQKPDPFHSQEVLDTFKCIPTEVVYIGDREVDKEFANSSGFKFIYFWNL